MVGMVAAIGTGGQWRDVGFLQYIVLRGRVYIWWTQSDYVAPTVLVGIRRTCWCVLPQQARRARRALSNMHCMAPSPPGYVYSCNVVQGPGLLIQYVD